MHDRAANPFPSSLQPEYHQLERCWGQGLRGGGATDVLRGLDTAFEDENIGKNILQASILDMKIIPKRGSVMICTGRKERRK